MVVGYRPAHRWQATMVLSASPGVAAMKTIVSTFIALAVLAGIAAPASAFDTKGFYQDLDRRAGGTAN
jgi:hypothetical protein